MARAKLRRFIFMLLGIVASAYCANASAISLSDCLTQSDVSTIDRDFFGTYPDKTAFEKYVDPAKFELLTNAADGAMLQRTANPASKKINWFIGILNDHKALFPDRTSFDSPDFDYVKRQFRGETPSVDNGRSTKIFPTNECVLEATYHLKVTQCVMSQKLYSLAITFIKEKRKIKLAAIEMFFCPAPRQSPGTNRDRAAVSCSAIQI